MKLLFVGDVVGGIGRRTLADLLPALRERHQPDFVVVNGENAAGGVGITERTAALRHQMRADRAQTARLDAVEAGITTAYRTRWHQLGGFAAFFALAALLLYFARVL